VLPFAVTLVGYVSDPSGRTHPALHPTAGEAALDRWIRTHTEPDAVFVDQGGTDRVMVLGERRLWAGTTAGPEKAAFPAAELAMRRAVADDLYGGGTQLAADAARLAALGRPVYVLYRASLTPGRMPWRALEADARFHVAYDADTLRVYRLAG
jgi:hypothetical protein